MLYGKKKLALPVFAFIYLVFGALLVWLFFFNQGLDFVEQDTIDGKKIFLKNISTREIKKISVLAVFEGTQINLLEVESLAPNQTIVIDTELIPEEKKVALLAQAQFYPTAQRELLSGAGGKDFRITLEMPTIAFEGSKTQAGIEICNDSRTTKTIEIELIIDQTFFQGDTSTKTMELKATECSKQTYLLDALKKGLTTINFKTKATNFNEEIQKAIEVK